MALSLTPQLNKSASLTPQPPILPPPPLTPQPLASSITPQAWRDASWVVICGHERKIWVFLLVMDPNSDQKWNLDPFGDKITWENSVRPLNRLKHDPS